MEIQPLKIGTKMAKVPVIQGGMGVGISLGNLAGAVAKEGSSLPLNPALKKKILKRIH